MRTERATASRDADEEPTDEQLRLVARHGSGPFERALATVRLCRRQGRLDELKERIGATEEVEE